MDTSKERIGGVCWYNEDLIKLIRRKLQIAKTLQWAYGRTKSKECKEDVNSIFNELQGMKDVLQTMHISLQINRDNSAIFQDLNTGFIITITPEF